MGNFINNLIVGTSMQKGIFVMVFGMLGVFFVLIVFYFLIKLIEKLFPYKTEEEV